MKLVKWMALTSGEECDGTKIRLVRAGFESREVPDMEMSSVFL